MEAIKIPNLEHFRAIEAVIKGTNSPSFFSSLSKNHPTDLKALMERAEKYIRQDDAYWSSHFAPKRKEEFN